MDWTPRKLFRKFKRWLPYRGAGIRVRYIADDWSEIRVSMRLTRFNENLVGTHFGGNLYSMVDPHLMLMAMHRLGPGYMVWDQSATIVFVKPGRGTVESVMRLSEEEVEQMREATANGRPYRPEFDVQVTNEKGEIVARVKKVLYVRKRRH